MGMSLMTVSEPAASVTTSLSLLLARLLSEEPEYATARGATRARPGNAPGLWRLP